MIIKSSALKSIEVPNKYPHHKYLLLTFNFTVYVFLGDEPDMNYKSTADIIGDGEIIIPKDICGKNIHFWQTYGYDRQVGIAEVDI